MSLISYFKIGYLGKEVVPLRKGKFTIGMRLVAADVRVGGRDFAGMNII